MVVSLFRTSKEKTSEPADRQGVGKAFAITALCLWTSVVGSALYGTRQHNYLANELAERSVNHSLQTAFDHVNQMNKDYANWADSFSSIVEEDLDWLKENIATSIFETQILDIFVVVPPEGSQNYGWVRSDKTPSFAKDVVEPALAQFMFDLLEGSGLTTQEPVSSFVEMDGELWALSVSYVTPTETSAFPHDIAGFPRQIIGIHIDEAWLSGAARPLELESLALSDVVGAGRVGSVVQRADGKFLRYLTWDASNPGDHMLLYELSWSLGIGLIIEACVLLWAYGRISANSTRLEDALRKAEAADEVKRQFLATISHELRTPLTSIKGAVDLLKWKMVSELPPRASHLVELASRNTANMYFLVEDVLEFSEYVSGSARLSRRPCNLTQVIETSVITYKFHGDARDVQYEFESPADPVILEIDPDRIAQLIGCLLSNAAKFSPKGSSVKLQLDDEKDAICFRVIDKGCGIPPEIRDNVFQKFWQGDSSRTRAHSGTGLGLTIARSIAEMHGAELDFISEVGKGTEFYLRIRKDTTQCIAYEKELETSHASAVW